MNFDEFRNLDLAEIASWPRAAKGIVWAVMVLLIWLLGYRLFVAPALDQLAAVRRDEPRLKQEFEQKSSLAARLKAHQDGMQGTSEAVGDMLGDLPGETEVAGLLEEITAASRDNGLTLQYFKPQPERHKGFYAIMPIRVGISGSYHQFGHFISDLAALPRIVTVDGIHIGRGGKGDAKVLKMELVVKAYRIQNKSEKHQAGQDQGSGP
jgi:type IV pilus assembly protein PilO